jgi:hypothetical protein
MPYKCKVPINVKAPINENPKAMIPCTPLKTLKTQDSLN